MAETGPDPAELYRQDQERYEANRRARENEPHWELPALNKINFYIETGNLPEDREILRKDWKKAGIESFDPLMQLQVDARTRFNISDYSVTRLAEVADGNLRDFQQAVIGIDGFEDLGSPELSGLARAQNANLVRIKAFHHLENHTIGFKNFYYDKSGVFKLLVTGRRHGAINAGDFISMMKPLDGLELTAAEAQAIPLSEEELYGEEISRMTADIEHFERAVAAMNRFNASKPNGQEMFMNVPEVERKLLRDLFGTSSTVDYVDNTKSGGTDNRINDKEFSTGLLSYYITADLENDRRRYEATMKALAEYGALDRLKELPREWVNIESANDKKALFDNMVIRVKEIRDRILTNWNSSSKPFRARLADFAYEQSFNLNTGSQNVAELAYRFKYERLPNGGYKIKVEIPGPEVGQDVVNGRAPLVHEATYKVVKGRGVTSEMPWPNPETIDELILIGLNESKGLDPKPIILANPQLAKGAAMLGLYPEADNLLDDKDLKDVKYVREKNGPIDPQILRVLEATLWMFDLSLKDHYLPMPIKPMYDSFNLYKVMKDPTTGKTVFETINEKEYGTLRDPEYKNMTWYQPDAWEVNMKMLEDVLSIQYGRQDPKYVDSLLDAAGGFGEQVKKWDIGSRAEKWEVDVRKSLDPKDVKNYKARERVIVPKGFIEITQIAYINVTHLAMEKYRIWEEGGWDPDTQRDFWEDVQKLVLLASFEPQDKGDIKNYRGTLMTLIQALAEWYTAPAREYNDEANKTTYQLNRQVPSQPTSYTRPLSVNDKK